MSDTIHIHIERECPVRVITVEPTGARGAAGTSATVAVGTTTTGAAGTNASVTNSGTTSAAVFNFTIPRGATGATGAAGAAGPNSVTSATTSDGTANLSIADLEVVGGELYTNGDYSQIYTQGTDAHIFTLGSGAEIFTEGALAQIYTTGASAQIYTAGAGATIGTQGANATIYTQGANATISTAGSAAHIQTSHASAAVKSTNFAAVESGGASLVDGSMQPCLTWSAGGRNLTIPSGTATTFNSTSYTYGTGAAAAHRTALGLTTLATTTPAANVANFLATPTSANLASALTDENGTGGGFVRAEGATLTSPTLVGPVNLTSQDSSTADRVMNKELTDLLNIGKMIYRVMPQSSGLSGVNFVASGGGNNSSVANIITIQCGGTLNNYATLKIGSYLSMSTGSRETINFSRKFLLHGTSGSAFSGTLNQGRTFWPASSTAYTTGALTSRGFGWLQVGSNLYGQTHDGTTLRTTTATVTRTTNTNDHLAIYGDGAGNYSFYRNGTLIETLAGPTGSVTVTQPVLICNTEAKEASQNMYVIWSSLEFISW